MSYCNPYIQSKDNRAMSNSHKRADNQKPKIIEYIEEINDPRNASSFNYKHPFVSIIFITFIGSLCGANNWIEIEALGNEMKDWIVKFVPLPYGVPSHDTFGRLFALIDSNEFGNFLIKWMKSVREKFSGEVINFDGKTLCGTAEKGMGLQGVHILNAWSNDNEICIGQLKVDDKSNEIKAIPKLMELLDLKDCIITSDALNTQKEVAKKARELGADYVLPVKENHPSLLDDIKLFFEDAVKKEFKGIDADQYETLDKGHGRVEKRTYQIIDGEDLPDKDLWKDVKSIGRVIRERTINRKGTTTEIQYYINSIDIDAKLFEKCTRGHWGVENGLHWRLDVIMKEDDNRYRDKNGAQNLAVIRKVTLSVLAKDTTRKGSIATKRLAAAVNPTYREDLIKKCL